MSVILFYMDQLNLTFQQKFGQRLGKLKKRAHVSFVKMSFGTSISANHINNTIKGKTNTTLKQLEAYARFFGLPAFELLEFGKPLPDRAILQENIRAHFESLGYITNKSFKRLGPSYQVEEFIEKYGPFQKPMEAAEIKDLVNQALQTNFKTNDVSRVLNRLAEEELLIKKETGNSKKPKYDTPQ